jgi:hypothetical protein
MAAAGYDVTNTGTPLSFPRRFKSLKEKQEWENALIKCSRCQELYHPLENNPTACAFRSGGHGPRKRVSVCACLSACLPVCLRARARVSPRVCACARACLVVCARLMNGSLRFGSQVHSTPGQHNSIYASEGSFPFQTCPLVSPRRQPANGLNLAGGVPRFALHTKSVSAWIRVHCGQHEQQ